MRRISDSQARCLRNAMLGRDLSHGVHGRSAFGGFRGTLASLCQAKYLDPKTDAITKEGILALAYWGDDEAVKWVDPEELKALNRKRK